MSTTSLIIELLITGLQALIWLILLIFCAFGHDWISVARIKEFETIIAVLLLPIVYPLGILVDYLADELLRPVEIQVRESFIKDDRQNAMRLMIELKDQSLSNHLGYLRSKIRISRSFTLNTVFISISGICFLIIRCQKVPNFPFWRLLLFYTIIGFTLSILSFKSWKRFNRSFFRRIAQLYNADAVFTDVGIVTEKFTEPGQV